MDELVDSLKRSGVITKPEIETAFRAVDRVNFVPSKLKGFAYLDQALPIGYNQTISQPSTVAMMLELLNVRKGCKVLDIGSGSGWTTALLAKLVGIGGFVVGVELVPELVKYGGENLMKYKPENAVIEQAGTTMGWAERAPYEFILISAATKKIPNSLLEQLTESGRILAPIKANGYESLVLYQKQDSKFKEINRIKEYGFVFVPLIES